MPKAFQLQREREHQRTKIEAAYDYLKARTGTWVSAVEVASVIHSLAVSTKLSQARELAKAEDCVIVWNEDPQASCYMLRPKPLGRDAADETDGQRNLPGFSGSFGH